MNPVRFSASLVLTMALLTIVRGRVATSLVGEIMKTVTVCGGAYLAFSWGAGRFRLVPFILLTISIVALRVVEVHWWQGSWNPLVWALIAVLLMSGQFLLAPQGEQRPR